MKESCRDDAYTGKKGNFGGDAPRRAAVIRQNSQEEGIEENVPPVVVKWF